MPPRRLFFTVREVIRLLEADGWYLVATKGSHRQYKHKIKAGRVTVAGKPSEEGCTRNTEQHPQAVRPEGVTACVTPWL
ncbi:type II toxin-antitoxin system HicA family toxin [Mesorhizobium sp.]|uniref:type II toxin-antitoxin system HicA family toxin n=1 Tax=Mesorhizobium sp. TaxID=1871066 RepID=UPI00267D5A73